MDTQGVKFGSRTLEWAEVRDITLRPRSVLLRYLALGTPAVRLSSDKRSQRIAVTRDHVADLEAFEDWLRHTRERQVGRIRPADQ